MAALNENNIGSPEKTQKAKKQKFEIIEEHIEFN